jgi:hypothetical protein
MRAGARAARAVALAGAAAILALAAGPAALAAGHTAPARPSAAARLLVGGRDLASTGVVVNRPASGYRRLPKVL